MFTVDIICTTFLHDQNNIQVDKNSRTAPTGNYHLIASKYFTENTKGLIFSVFAHVQNRQGVQKWSNKRFVFPLDTERHLHISFAQIIIIIPSNGIDQVQHGNKMHRAFLSTQNVGTSSVNQALIEVFYIFDSLLSVPLPYNSKASPCIICNPYIMPYKNTSLHNI